MWGIKQLAKVRKSVTHVGFQPRVQALSSPRLGYSKVSVGKGQPGWGPRLGRGMDGSSWEDGTAQKGCELVGCGGLGAPASPREKNRQRIWGISRSVQPRWKGGGTSKVQEGEDPGGPRSVDRKMSF